MIVDKVCVWHGNYSLVARTNICSDFMAGIWLQQNDFPIELELKIKHRYMYTIEWLDDMSMAMRVLRHDNVVYLDDVIYVQHKYAV